MIAKTKEALLHLIQKQQGKWAEVQQNIAPELLEKFKVLGYIRHIKDKWQITSEGVKKSLFYSEPTPKEHESK